MFFHSLVFLWRTFGCAEHFLQFFFVDIGNVLMVSWTLSVNSMMVDDFSVFTVNVILIDHHLMNYSCEVDGCHFWTCLWTLWTSLSNHSCLWTELLNMYLLNCATHYFVYNFADIGLHSTCIFITDKKQWQVRDY